MALSDLCPKVTYEVKKICCCEVIDDKNPSKNIFRIVRQSKDGSFKNLDFEAPSAITSMHCFTFRVLWVGCWVGSFGWEGEGGRREWGRRKKGKGCGEERGNSDWQGIKLLYSSFVPSLLLFIIIVIYFYFIYLFF